MLWRKLRGGRKKYRRRESFKTGNVSKIDTTRGLVYSISVAWIYWQIQWESGCCRRFATWGSITGNLSYVWDIEKHQYTKLDAKIDPQKILGGDPLKTYLRASYDNPKTSLCATYDNWIRQWDLLQRHSIPFYIFESMARFRRHKAALHCHHSGCQMLQNLQLKCTVSSFMA